MSNKYVVTDEAPQAPSLLSQAVISNNLVFVAGQIHNKVDGTMIEGTVSEKLAQIMTNISAILSNAGTSLNNAVSLTVYVTDMAQMAELNAEYPKYFTDGLPARAAIGVQALPLGATVEISLVASI